MVVPPLVAELGWGWFVGIGRIPTDESLCGLCGRMNECGGIRIYRGA